MNKIDTSKKYSAPLCSGTAFTKLKTALYATFLLFTIVITGCKKDDFEGEVSGDCPVVVSTDPLDKAVDVPFNKVISITFNTDMDAATINNSTFIIKQGTTVIAGKVEPTAVAKTFTFKSTTDLLPFTTYTGTVTTGAKDNFKTAMVSDYTWTFTTIPQVTLTFAPVLGGTVSGAGAFAQGSVTPVSAFPSTNFTFANWTDNGKIVSTSATYLLTMAGNKALVANFIPVPIGSFAVNLSSSPAAGGTVTGNGAFPIGTFVTVKEAANAGYAFQNWTENGNVVSTNSTFQFTISSNRTLVANYKVVPGPANGLNPINLGTAGDFVTLTKSGISTTGLSKVTGDIGVSPAAATAITGFGLIMDTNGQSSHTPIVTGKVYASDYAAPTPAKMTTAVSDMETAFTTANGLTTPAPIVGLYSGDISGRTLAPGLYKWSTGVLITSAGVTLSGGPNDVWVFQISQDFTVSNSAKITLLGGAQAKNIFWVVSGQATLGTNSDVSGNILSKTLISLNTGAKVTGRLLAQTAVTLNAATVTQP
jgi:hypothetical protein